MKYQNDAEFDYSIDNIVKSVMIYPLLSFKYMGRSLNVSIVHLNAWRNFDLFLVDIFRYQITIDLQLKFALFPVKYFLSTTLVHKKYFLCPT